MAFQPSSQLKAFVAKAGKIDDAIKEKANFMALLATYTLFMALPSLKKVNREKSQGVKKYLLTASKKMYRFEQKLLCGA